MACHINYPNQERKGHRTSFLENTEILQMHNEMMVQVKNGMAKDGMDFWHIKVFFHL